MVDIEGFRSLAVVSKISAAMNWFDRRRLCRTVTSPRNGAQQGWVWSAVLGVLCFAVLTADATPVRAPHVQVELVADTTALAPGHDATLGIRFALEDGWHVYWRNPGDSGEAPSIAWQLPAGFTAGEIQWPAPQRIPVGSLANFGYKGTPLLPVPLHVPRDLAGVSAVEIQARVKWLVCNPEECIPGTAPLSLTLPVGDPGPSSATPAFEEAHRRLPVAPPPTWRLSASATAETLTLSGPGGAPQLMPGATFFPYRRDVIEPSAPQLPTLDADGFRLTLQRWRQSTVIPTALEGVLAVGDMSYNIA